MKSVLYFLIFTVAISMSNVVGAGVLLVLMDVFRPEEVFSCVAIAILAIACAITFLDGVVHLGVKHGFGN